MYIQNFSLKKEKKHRQNQRFFHFLKEVRAGFEPAVTELQSGALPLGYRTIFNLNDSNGNRTRVTAVKGRCLNRLTMEPRQAACFDASVEPSK